MTNRIASTEQALTVIEGRWVEFVGRVAMGDTIATSLEAARLSRPIFEGLVRTSKVHKQQFEDAKTSYMRTLWDDDTLDGVLAGIARGLTIEKACAAHGRTHDQLHTLAIRDPAVYERYMETMKIKSLSLAEAIIEIADDTSNDIQMDGKGNNAAVKRSELMASTRVRLMESWFSRVFGKNAGQAVNVSVTVNHAERLQEARARRDRLPVVDAEVVNVESEVVNRTADSCQSSQQVVEVPAWLQ